MKARSLRCYRTDRALRRAGCGAAGRSALLAGCATRPQRQSGATRSSRSTAACTRFNDGVDDAVLRAGRPPPTATTLPPLVRTGVDQLLRQPGRRLDRSSTACCSCKLQDAPRTSCASTSTPSSALGGMLDVASEVGIERHSEDFGQTLGRWGVPPGPYLVLPLLGPSTVRDTVALPVDRQGDPVSYVDDGACAIRCTCCAWSTRAPTCCAPASARRRRARQVQLHARRPPAAPPRTRCYDGESARRRRRPSEPAPATAAPRRCLHHALRPAAELQPVATCRRSPEPDRRCCIQHQRNCLDEITS